MIIKQFFYVKYRISITISEATMQKLLQRERN